MHLRALLGHGVTVQGSAWQDVEITALATDSREVGQGMLFAALPGSKLDGSSFIPQALARGAAAVLADASFKGGDLGVPLILDPQPRRRLALIAARFYQKQPRCVVAVTGTNGKTSVVGFTRQLWAQLGRPAASLGTLGLEGPAGLGAPGLTTPDPIALHRLLAELAEDGIDHLALEASSHGLDQHRLDGVRIRRRRVHQSVTRPLRLSRRRRFTTRRPSSACSASCWSPREPPCSTPISRSSDSSPKPVAHAASRFSTTAGRRNGCA